MGDYRVRLGGIDFHAAYPGPAPLWHILQSISGWEEKAQDGTDTSQHWSGQGSTAGAAQTESRQITIESVMRGTSQFGAGSTLAGMDALNRLGRTTLVVSEDGRALVREADVRVTQVQSTRVSALVRRVTISLTADDPLRYSAESRTLFNGVNLLPNRGGRVAFPRLALTGPHGAITITHPGGVWTFPALASGSRLIDFREHIVWNGNARVFGVGSGPEARVLGDGSSWTVAGLGAGTAILTRAEAWS